ncbi:MAG: hypothetical protein RBT71_04685 [Flavobacteriales bacterium]|jgi:hypothetical protein|nr:hypothetical protein [Flavobacteriales bacterium]
MNILLRSAALAMVLFVIMSTQRLDAQHWKNMVWDDSLTFRSVEDAFLRDRAAGIISDSAKDVKEFKRFEYFWRPRVNSSDPAKRDKLNNYGRELRFHYENGPFCTTNLNPTPWTSLGPVTSPAGSGSYHYMGIIISVWSQPGVTPVTEVLAGTNSSGLWRGTAGPGGGAWQWQPLTESLRMPGMGVSTIAVDDGGTIYIGTSMGYRNAGYSAGVWRSEDGGSTWENLADMGPDAFHNSGWDIKIIDGYMYVVMDRKVLRASMSIDLAAAGAFTDITPVPGQGSAGRYTGIEQFRESSIETILVLTSESKGGRKGGGLVHTSLNGGDAWTDVTSVFSTMNTTFLVEMDQPSRFVGYDNGDPDGWHLNSSPDHLSIVPITPNITAQVAYDQPNVSYGLVDQGTYDLVMDFTKDPNATLRVYTQDCEPGDPISIAPDRLLHEFTTGTGGSVVIPVEVRGYPARVVMVVEYSGSATNGVQINSLLLQTDAMERFRVDAVNDLVSPYAGIYVASLPPSVAGPWPAGALKIHRITDVGQPFSLFHTVTNGQLPGLFGENGGEFRISRNGNLYFGGPNNLNSTNNIRVLRSATSYTSFAGSNHAHADTRAILIVQDLVNGSETILKGDDGGVCVAYDGGATTLTMTSLNGSYFPITQYYGMGVDEREQVLLAGAQDNGTWRRDMPAGTWTNPHGGDGGESRVLSAHDGSYWAMAWIINQQTRIQNFGSTSCLMSNSEGPWELGNPVELYEVRSEDKVRAYLSHKRLWKLDCAIPNPGQNMMASLPGYANFVWGIGIHEDNDDLIFVGGHHISWNENVDPAHGLLRTRDNGATWVDLTPQLRNLTTGTGSQPMAWYGITDVVVDPDVPADQPATVYVSFNGFESNSNKRVYKSVVV